MVTEDQKVHHIWRLIQLHHCLNAGKVNMQQLQRCGNNDQSHWGFGMNAFMLNASLTAANCPLHLSGHVRPPELVIQQAHCLLWALVSSIIVTSIHGSIHGPEIAQLLPVHQQECGNCKGFPGRGLTSSTLGE